MFRKSFFRKISCIFLALVLITLVEGVVYGVEKDKRSKMKPVMTEAELQSRVMSFVDSFAALMVTSFEEFQIKKPPKKDRYEVLAMITYSISNGYIIAGESDPDVALLDIFSMVTLGRIIFEEEGPLRYGKTVQPIIRGFRKAEKDIRKIASMVLRRGQLGYLMSIIKGWRKENPGLAFYPPVRFSDFAAHRRDSKLTKAESKRGLINSVEAATERAEEMRLLAERGMYLVTRMPQLSGLYAELWLTRLLESPYTAEVLADISTLSISAERLASVAEALPDQIAVQREATIKQAMKSITHERIDALNQITATLSTERKAIIDAFAAEEGSIRGLLTDLRQTLETGNQFMGSLNAVATQFKSVNPSEPAKPFDIRDLQMTLVELSNSAQELTKFSASLERISDKVVANQLIPQVANALGEAEKKGEELIDFTMHQMILLIVIGLIGYIIAKLLIEYFLTKMRTSNK